LTRRFVNGEPFWKITNDFRGITGGNSARMVKNFIQANFQINAAALAATAASPAPSSSAQRRQRQRPAHTTQATCLLPPTPNWPSLPTSCDPAG